MSGEPELHPQTSDQWVTYLKQLMQHYQLWNGDTEPDFTDELAAAVRTLQATYSISPADGVVRADTWAILTGETSSTQPADEHHYSQQQHDQQHHSEQHPTQHQDLQPDANAHPQQVPATFSNHGLPAFEFELPEIPLAHADIETPQASIHVELSMTGKVKVTFPEHVEGASIGNDGLEVEATHAVGHLNQGIQIGGVGTHEMTVSDTINSQYGQTTFGLDSSGAMVFTGSAHIAYSVPTNGGNAEVEGEVGYSIKVHVLPHPQPQEEELQPVQDESTWFERHHDALVQTGEIILIAIVVVGAVAIVVATGGTALGAAVAL